MAYTKIQDKLWRDLIFRGLPDSSKLLYLYLFTNKHKTMIGLYEIPLGYIAHDLNMGIETVSERLENLIETGLIQYDYSAEIVLIPHFLEHNPFDNKNVEKSAVCKLLELPETPLFIPFLDCLETLSKRYQYLIETVSNTETVTEYRNSTRNSTRTTPKSPPETSSDVLPAEVASGGGGGNELSESNIQQLQRIGKTYEDDIGLIPSNAMQDFRYYLLEQKLSVDVIIKAIQEAAGNNARRWSYIKSILDRCVKEKIFTISDWNKNEMMRAHNHAAHAQKGGDGNGRTYTDRRDNGEFKPSTGFRSIDDFFQTSSGEGGDGTGEGRTE